jgi:glucosamine--fructose-6-phosphate aminotransferase (isomerizing)
MPAKVEAELALSPQIGDLTERYRYMRDCVVLGRGYNYATAFEVALKLKELTYTVVQPYSSADFLHGPLAVIERGFPVIVIAPSGLLEDEMRALIATLGEREAEIACISDRPDVCALAPLGVEVPRAVPEWLSPLTMVVPGQLLAMHLAHERGHDVDAPRAIRKVTRTR